MSKVKACCYKCECGKEFDNPQKFNGHKSSCLIHLESKGISKEEWLSNKQAQRKHCVEVSQRKQAEKQAKSLQIWISEEHHCEKCGKLMTKKYGSGRFCCRACANSHNHKLLATEKNIKGLLEHNESQHKKKLERIRQYEANPKICKYCGMPIPYSKRERKFCSKVCADKDKKRTVLDDIKRRGPRNKFGVRGHCIFGTFRDIECDSSWELAFVTYNLEHNISFKRNKESFKYMFDGQEHLYYPDFILSDGTYVEIKNYWTEQVQAKIDQFPNPDKYKILYYNDIKYMINYCIDKYGRNFPEILYDKSKPNYYENSNS